MEKADHKVGMRECAHARLDYLGSGGNVVYRRCRDCGIVIIGREGRLWALFARPA